MKLNFFPYKRIKAGIVISSDDLRSALIYSKGKIFSIKHLSDFDMPPGTINPSFKKENILNETIFLDFLKQVGKGLKIKKVNVALPDAAAKLMIKTFRELPKEHSEIDDMVLWSVSNALELPITEVRVSWEIMGIDKDNNHVFFVSMGLKSVVAQYEKLFKKAGLDPAILAPAGLNQFNFYSSIISDKDNVAFLALFHEYINIFVFENGVPVFYKTIKKGLFSELEESAINDVDLLMQYFNSENPDFELDRLYIASPIKLDQQIEQLFSGIDPIDFTIIDEKKLIAFDKKIKIQPDIKPLSFYSAAIGAAQGV